MSKIMDTAEKEVIRREILELCRETQPYGAGRPALKAALRKSSYDVSDKELLTHVEYLKGKGLIRTEEVSNKRLGINRVIAHLTPEGMDYLDGNGPDIVGVD
mgnify:CR=1 FL=1